MRSVSPGVLRILLIVGSVISVVHWPAASELVLWVSFVWFVPRLHGIRLELLRARGESETVRAHVSALEASLEREKDHAFQCEVAIEILHGLDDHKAAELKRVTEALRKAESKLRKRGRAPDPSETGDNSIFHRVGLDPDAPRFVVEAAQRAYRIALHPDWQPPERKIEAERHFKEAEQAFSEVWRLRGF
jgi:hypothetical protein